MLNIGRTASTIFTFLILTFSKNCLASPQLPDYVIYKTDTLPVYNLILEQYLEKLNKSENGSLFGLKFRDGASLNCWRGYQAIYLLSHDSLFLTDIIACGERSSGHAIDGQASRQRVRDLFNGKVVNNKVFLNWYSGEFSLPKGDLLRWDGVFHKTFEQEILIQVDNGKVTHTSEIENYLDHPKRLNRRYTDTISNVLFKRLERLKWKTIGRFDCSEKYIITIGTNGRVSKVSMVDYQTAEEIDKLWERTEYNYCINTIQNGLRRLKFDIVKEGNRPIEEDIYLQIWFEENGRLVNLTN
ncbi:MAG TPA: hypothetical protein VFW11_02360 [Cyclobacteriaceae bacterium]|nr:hypothetical protein [Cyclobacteriaceae bacterium]